MKKILIVDNNFANLKVLGKYFSEQNFTVLIAITTDQAIKITQAKIPDIILSVFTAPTINGMELTKTLKSKKQTKAIPLLFILDKKSKKQVESIHSFDHCDYLLKPCLPKDLLNKTIQLTSNKNKTLLTNNKPVILVVDDMEVNRNLIEAFFENSLFNILKSSSGRDSLKKIKENKIDLILLDIEMPEMNGWQTLERYKKMKLNIPVMAISAHSDKIFEKKCIDSGFKGIVSKPINRNLLTHIINNVLQTTSNINENKPPFSVRSKTDKKIGYIDISRLLQVSKNDADLKISTYKKFLKSINGLQKILAIKTETIAAKELQRKELHTFINLCIYFCKSKIVKSAKEMEVQFKNNPEIFNKNKKSFLILLNDIKNELRDLQFNN